MARGKPYKPETQATALAALAISERVSSVARRRGISRTTATMGRAAAGLSETTGVVHEKKAAIGPQLVGCREDSIELLARQVCVMRDEARLRPPSAVGLALVHRGLFDKTARLLAAFRLAHDALPSSTRDAARSRRAICSRRRLRSSPISGSIPLTRARFRNSKSYLWRSCQRG